MPQRLGQTTPLGSIAVRSARENDLENISRASLSTPNERAAAGSEARSR
jgi:hypothetical protein